jgi:hypothetical protein
MGESGEFRRCAVVTTAAGSVALVHVQAAVTPAPSAMEMIRSAAAAVRAKRKALRPAAVNAEQAREVWGRVKLLPPSARERWLARPEALAVLGAEAAATEVRDLRRQRARLETMACSAVLVDAVWERGERYFPDVACDCEACGGKRRWPAYYVEGGRSFECAEGLARLAMEAAGKERLGVSGEDEGLAEELALLRPPGGALIDMGRYNARWRHARVRRG